MSSLHLTVEDLEHEDLVLKKTFSLLNDYLQPETSLSLEAVSQQILRMLTDKEFPPSELG